VTDRAGGDRLDVVSVENGQIAVQLLPGVGGRLHRLRAFGHDLLRTPADPAIHLSDPFMWGAYLMAPWCNRIAATATDVGGQRVNVPANFPDGSAIHGLVGSVPWHLDGIGRLSVHGGGTGWPWPFECALQVAVRDAGIGIDLQLTNRADTPMPAGLGLHPWFRRPLEVRIQATELLASNLDRDARFEPIGGDLDLRTRRPMPQGVDATWGGIGDPAVELHWPELGVTGTMRARSTGGLFVVAASPLEIEAVAIEAETNAPHGLDRYLRGELGALSGLAPGATMRLAIELALSLDGAPDAAYHA
jgi:aldose 1-epimerase